MKSFFMLAYMQKKTKKNVIVVFRSVLQLKGEWGLGGVAVLVNYYSAFDPSEEPLRGARRAASSSSLLRTSAYFFAKGSK